MNDSPPARRPSSTPAEASSDPGAIILGRHLSAAGIGPRIRDPGERHVIVFGPNGSGKGTRLLVPNLLQLENRSIFVIDPKGELAAITARHRADVSEVVVINPFDVLAGYGTGLLKSRGFNPLAALNHKARSFNADVGVLAGALIKTESQKEPYWDNSARALMAALIMYVVEEAFEERSIPTLDRVRELLCSASGVKRPGKGTLDRRGKGTPQACFGVSGRPAEELVGVAQPGGRGSIRLGF